MAEGRKNVSDRLLPAYFHAAGDKAASTDLPDLAEDEIWWPDAAAEASEPDKDQFWLAGSSGSLAGDQVGSLFLAPEDRAAAASEPQKGLKRGDWVPPHEYLAKEKGRTAATSVLVGVGRTLKGRDMSRVRDAVWSRTGFFGWG